MCGCNSSRLAFRRPPTQQLRQLGDVGGNASRFAHSSRSAGAASRVGKGLVYLKAEPYNYRRRQTKHDYEHAALKQGHIAVNSILRDPFRIAIVQEAVAFVLGCYDVSVFGEG